MKNLWNRLFGDKRPPEPLKLEGQAKDFFLRDFMLTQLRNTFDNVRVRNNEAHVTCPYHGDSSETPTVSIALTIGAGRKQGMFYCFGCNEHGSWAKFAEKMGMERMPFEPDDPPELTPVFNGLLGRQFNRGRSVGRAHRPGHTPRAQTHYFDVQPAADWDRAAQSRQDNSSLNLANIALMGNVLSTDTDTRRESCASHESTRHHSPDPSPSSYDSPSSDGGGGDSGGGCD